MKKVKLSQNKMTLVDDDIYEKIKDMSVYYNGGYARLNLPTIEKGRYRKILLHRYIMGDPIDHDVDHINGDKLDNRKENLRLANMSQNKANCGLRSNNTIGYKGVVFMRNRNKCYMARIRVNYIYRYLGYYYTPEEAALAYNQAALKYFGDYAKLNEVNM